MEKDSIFSDFKRSQFKRVSFLYGILGLLILSCGKKAGNAVKTEDPSQPERYLEQVLVNSYGRLKKTWIPEEDIPLAEKKVRESPMELLTFSSSEGLSAESPSGSAWEEPRPADPSGASLRFFTWTRSKEDENSSRRLILRSRFIFLYNPYQSVQALEDGSISLPVSFALVDGLSPVLWTGESSYPLPPGYYDRSTVEAFHRLGEEPGRPWEVMSPTECPRQMVLQSDAGRFNPLKIEHAYTHCPMNTLMRVTLHLQKEEWDRLRLSLTQKTKVFVETVLAKPLIQEEWKLTLTPESLLERMRALFQSGRAYSREEITRALTSLLQEICQSFQIPFQAVFFQEVLDRLWADFFEGTDSTEEVFEGRFKHLSPGDLGDFSFLIRIPKNIPSGFVLKSESDLTFLSSHRVPFLLKQSSEDPFTQPTVRERGSRNLVFTQGRSDEFFEFEVDQVLKTQVNLAPKVGEKISNRVCTRPYDLCLEGHWSCGHCQSKFRYGKYIVPPSSPCEVCSQIKRGDAGDTTVYLPYPIGREEYYLNKFCDHKVHWECTQILPNQCDPIHYEDRWTQTTEWSTHSGTTGLSPAKFTQASQLEQVLQQLSLEVESEQYTEQCPLSALSYEVLNATKWILRFKNTPSCQIFRTGQEKLKLTLYNPASFKEEYQCGSTTRFWDDRVTHSCLFRDGSHQEEHTTVDQDLQKKERGERGGIWAPYYPRLQLQGHVTPLGKFFITQNERTHVYAGP